MKFLSMPRLAAAAIASGAALCAALAQDSGAAKALWREDFNTMPDAWKVRTKPGTSPAVFTAAKDPATGETFLNMAATNASASLVTDPEHLDPQKAPVIRWRWRVAVFPQGADGRNPDKDDQAIGVYISTGSFLRQRSIAYRWETDTPVGAEGTTTYAAGVVSVKWICLRNRQSSDGKTFLVEERNFLEDFRKAYGFEPKQIGISISCNSQYTGTTAEAQLDWMEFLPASAGSCSR